MPPAPDHLVDPFCRQSQGDLAARQPDHRGRERVDARVADHGQHGPRREAARCGRVEPFQHRDEFRRRIAQQVAVAAQDIAAESLHQHIGQPIASRGDNRLGLSFDVAGVAAAARFTFTWPFIRPAPGSAPPL
ncbi:hypothetical protein WM28_31440 [Burkholderia ubonensis]|nr:hypothetical protein WM28_31440 [Burkholderia ubonensis]